MTKSLEREFIRLYPEAKVLMESFCPYRLCPIGAHSDHQFGLVSGFAIDKGIEIVFFPSENGICEIRSMNFPGRVQFHIADIREKKNDWADYLRGAVKALAQRVELRCGICALISGSLPIGGLSSSAAVILAFISAMCKANSVTLTSEEMIETALWAENEYVGVKVGKLDQSCEIYSKKDHLLYLDTKDGTYELIPKSDKMKPFEFAVIFSGVERTLAGSAFNMRVDETKAASYALKAFAGLDYGKFSDSRLRDVPREVYELYKDRLPGNWRKRAEHYYSEFDRVVKGSEAWKNGDIELFGKLSSESGHSSIYNYETGSDELKTIYEIMMQTDGIYGGRFSGAGFKGCCMAIIDPEFKSEIKSRITKEYLDKFPQYRETFSIHYCKSADGVE